MPSDLKFFKKNKNNLQNDIFKFLFLDKKRINKYPRYIKLLKLGNPAISDMSDYNKINFIISKML